MKISNAESFYREISLRSEYEMDFAKKCSDIGISLFDALSIGNIDEFRKFEVGFENVKDLEYIFVHDINVVKLHMASVVMMFINASIKGGLPKDIAENILRKYYYSFADCETNNDIKETLIKMSEDVFIAMNKFSMNCYSPIVKRAIEFIHNNKFKFIYARDVANAIKVNRSYLSRIFKAETDENLTDYIHKAKIELAIELMESNYYKFDEVAELLGYKDYTYFSKVFKRVTKQTPYQYMRNNNSNTP